MHILKERDTLHFFPNVHGKVDLVNLLAPHQQSGCVFVRMFNKGVSPVTYIQLRAIRQAFDM